MLQEIGEFLFPKRWTLKLEGRVWKRKRPPILVPTFKRFVKQRRLHHEPTGRIWLPYSLRNGVHRRRNGGKKKINFYFSSFYSCPFGFVWKFIPSKMIFFRSKIFLLIEEVVVFHIGRIEPICWSYFVARKSPLALSDLGVNFRTRDHPSETPIGDIGNIFSLSKTDLNGDDHRTNYERNLNTSEKYTHTSWRRFDDRYNGDFTRRTQMLAPNFLFRLQKCRENRPRSAPRHLRTRAS